MQGVSPILSPSSRNPTRAATTPSGRSFQYCDTALSTRTGVSDWVSTVTVASVSVPGSTGAPKLTVTVSGKVTVCTPAPAPGVAVAACATFGFGSGTFRTGLVSSDTGWFHFSRQM